MNLTDLYPVGGNLGESITISQFISPIIQNVSIAIGILSFITLVLAGFRYVANAGNEKEIKNATDTITYSLIGLGLSVLAYWITRILFAVGGFGDIF